MTVPEDAWINFIDALRKVNDTAADKMSEVLKKLPEWYATEHRQELIDYAYAIATKYGEASAELACEMYDAIGEASGLTLPPAVPAETSTYSEIAKTINGVIKQAANEEMLAAAVGRQVKQTGVDTTMENAIRDGAEWAWIPHGDTCAFCITLASRGWQKASKKALKNGHAEHIHANCDCTYAVRHDGKTTYAGYDPDRYLDWYMNVDPGGKPKDKINALRREFYKENADYINDQKRDAYAKRKERESSAAEELNVN